MAGLDQKLDVSEKGLEAAEINLEDANTTVGFFLWWLSGRCTFFQMQVSELRKQLRDTENALEEVEANLQEMSQKVGLQRRRPWMRLLSSFFPDITFRSDN